MDGLDWTASAMRAARTQLEIATHNLANVSAGGFRKAVAAIAMRDDGLHVSERIASEQGAVRATDASRASVTTADGRTYATRDGGVTWAVPPLQESSVGSF